jgi:cytochrome c556
MEFTSAPKLSLRASVWLVALATSAASCATSSPAPTPPQEPQLLAAVGPPARLEPPEYLPDIARNILRARMASHAHDMGELMSAIMILDYPRVHDGAQAIVSDVSLARPLTGDATELNSALPTKFFDLQDELKVRGRALRDAAHRQSALEVADAYGRLSETCVHCHAVYRAGR